MTYDDPIFPSSKAILRVDNDLSLRRFKCLQLAPVPGKEAALDIEPPSLVPWITRQIQKERYRKTTTQLGASNFIDVVKKDGLFDSIVWHTTAPRIKQAVRFGIVKTQSLTSQVIGALGQYRLIELERIQEGFIGNRYQSKEKLLNHYQDHFEALEALESLVNQSPAIEEFEMVMAGYLKHLEEAQKNLEQDAASSSIEKHIHAQLCIHIAQNKRRAEYFCKAYRAHPTDRATGVSSILTFVKNTMIRDLRKMQQINQDITYTRKLRFALTRGELNSCIEDAERIIEEYRAPPRDAMYPQHHGVYGEEEVRVAYDSALHCHTDKALARAVLAVHFIEEQNGLDLSDSKHPYCWSQKGGRAQLIVAKGTVWYVPGGVLVAMKHTGAWLLNVCIKLLAGPIELLFTLLVEPLTWGRFPRFFEAIRRLAMTEVAVKNPYAPTLDGHDILRQLKQSRVSLGLRLRQLIDNFFRNAIRDLLYGVRDIFQELTIHLFDAIRDDYAAGEALPALDEVLKQADHDWAKIQVRMESIREDLSLEEPPAEENVRSERFVSPPFIPSTGEYDDILNAGVSGSDQFVTFFTHHIHAKHPFVGLVFTLGYLSTAGAVLFPHFMAWLGQPFIVYSERLAASMAKGPISGAMGAGFTTAQLGASVADVLINGRYSGPVSSAAAFEKDPFTTSLYAGMALGLGYLFVYRFNVPWLSNALRKDIGTFPPNSLIFIGAKLGVLVYELLKEQHMLPHDEAQHFLPFVTAKTTVQEIIEKLNNVPENEKTKELKSKITLLAFIMQYQGALRSFSPHTKSRILLLLQNHFSSDEVASFKQWLYPQDTVSILHRTLKIIAYYPAILIRFGVACLFSLTLWNRRPVEKVVNEFSMTLLKDLTRVGRAASQGGKIFVAFIRRHLKTVGDVFFNSGLARSEAVLAGTHHIAESNYRISATLDVAYEEARQSTPLLDAGIRRVTPAHPLHLMPHLVTKRGFFAGQGGGTLQPAQNSSKTSPTMPTPMSTAA